MRSALGRRRRELRQRRFHAQLRRRGVGLEPRCEIAPGSQVSGQTSFGLGTAVNGPGVFKGSEPILIGRYCAIGDGVRMISSNHRTDVINLQHRLQGRLGLPVDEESRGPIRVGHNVWIGDAAIILSGVTIGNGAAIGAGSVVTKDVPAYAIAVGCPARVLRNRLPDATIEALESSEWWNWPEEEMRRHIELFREP